MRNYFGRTVVSLTLKLQMRNYDDRESSFCRPHCIFKGVTRTGAQHLAVASAPRGNSHPRGAAQERFEKHNTNNANAACRASGVQLCSAISPCTNLLEPAAIESRCFLDQRSKGQTCVYRCGSGSREPIGAHGNPACSTLPPKVAKVPATSA